MTSVGIMASAVHLAGDVLLEPFNDLSVWTVAGTPTIVAGRTGTVVQVADAASNVTFTIPPANESAQLVVGLAWRVSSLAAERTVFNVRSDSAATIHNIVTASTTGQLKIWRAPSTVLGTSSAGVITINTWYYIELQITLGDSASYTARVNGVQVENSPVIDTKNAGTKTVYDSVRVGHGAAVTALADDLYISTGPSAAFKGDITIP